LNNPAQDCSSLRLELINIHFYFRKIKGLLSAVPGFSFPSVKALPMAFQVLICDL